MTEKEKAYYKLGKLDMAKAINDSIGKSNRLLNSNNVIYLMGIRDAWNVIHDAINTEVDAMTKDKNNG